MGPTEVDSAPVQAYESVLMVTVELVTGTAVPREVPMRTCGALTGYISPDPFWKSP